MRICMSSCITFFLSYFLFFIFYFFFFIFIFPLLSIYCSLDLSWFYGRVGFFLLCLNAHCIPVTAPLYDIILPTQKCPKYCEFAAAMRRKGK